MNDTTSKINQAENLYRSTKPITGNRFFQLWTEYVLGHRLQFFVIILVITGFLGTYLVTHLTVDTDVERYLDEDNDAIVVLEKLRDVFGQDAPFVVNIRGDVFSMSYLNRLKQLHQELESMQIAVESLGQRKRSSQSKVDKLAPQKDSDEDDEFFSDEEGWDDEESGTIVEQITSLVNYRQVKKGENGLSVTGLLDEWPTEKELSSLKTRVLEDESIVGTVVDREATHSTIILLTDFMSATDVKKANQEIVRICNAYQAPDFHVMVTGGPVVVNSINDEVLNDQMTITSMAMLLIIVIVSIVFRHPLGVLGPFLVVLLADIWTLGLMGLTKTPITTTTSMISAFIACVGIGDAIHIQSVYRNMISKGVGNQEAIVNTISETGIPILYTSLTTAVGLLSLNFATLGGIGELGIFGAFGVTAALINSLVLLPMMLSFNRKSLFGISKTTRKSVFIESILAFCNGLSRPHSNKGRLAFTRRNILLSVAIGASVLIIIGLFKIQIYHDGLEWFPKDHPTYTDLMEYENSIGGIGFATLFIEAKNGSNLKQKEKLESLQALERHIKSYHNGDEDKNIVLRSNSLLDIVKESWSAVNNNQPQYHRLPKTQQGINDMITLFENSDPDELKRFVTIDMKQAILRTNIRWVAATEYQELIDHIERGIDKYIDNDTLVKATGSAVVTSLVVSMLLWDLLKSFGGAIFIITLCMIALLRNVKLGLLAMVPNLFPVMAALAMMGFLSIHLDAGSVIIGSLAIGIVVDDTMHFLHQFKVHYQEHADVEAAISHAFQHAGRAIIITSIILTAGFLCQLFGILMVHKIDGCLLSGIVILALAIDLCVCPALLRAVYR